MESPSYYALEFDRSMRFNRSTLGVPDGLPVWPGVSGVACLRRPARDFDNREFAAGGLGHTSPDTMRLPKFIRRLKRQQSEAEKLRTHHQREAKLAPIRGELEDAPDWPDGSGARAMREIRDLYPATGKDQ